MPTKREHLYLTTEVDVPTGGKPEKPGDPIPTKRVGPGLLSEVEISEGDLKKLQSGRARGIIRPATADEIELGQSRALNAKMREVAAEVEDERQAAEIERDNERKAAAAKLEQQKVEELAEIDADHEKARAKEREQAAEEINKAAGVKSGKKK